MKPNLAPLLSARELNEILTREDIIVLDTTWALSYEGPKSPGAVFAESHIPGARLFDFRRVADASSPFHDTVCSPEQFENYVRELGLTDQHVVCYSQGLFSGAARAFWLFRYFGHQRVSVLDGGLDYWRAEGFAVTTETTNMAKGSFKGRIRSELYSDIADVESALRDGIQLVDARPPDVFSGQRDFFANLDSPARGRPGNISESSKNLTSGSVIRKDGRLLPARELHHAVVENAGIDPSQKTIASCSLGVGASAAAFVLYLLGAKHVSVFDGSWEEWASRGAENT